jgi:hypothetical protein
MTHFTYFRRFIDIFAIAILILSLGNTTPARAGETERQEVILEMFEVMQYDKMIGQIAEIAGKEISKLIKQKFPNIDDEILAAIGTIVGEEFTSLKPDMMIFVGQFMSQNFTEPELKEMLAFYKTDVGRKWVTVMPAMTQQMMAWLPSFTVKFQQRSMQRIGKLLQKKGYNL